MRIDQDGMSLWFETADAPAPGEIVADGANISLTVAVQPPDASNQVEVLYRIDGGPVQALPAKWFRNDLVRKAQYFRAQFPALRAGDKVEYSAICRCAGRQIPSAAEAERLASSFRIAGGEKPALQQATLLSRPAAQVISSRASNGEPEPIPMEEVMANQTFDNITVTGNVGIGTTNLSNKLHVSGATPADANNAQLRISATDGNFMLLGRAANYGFVQSHNREPLVLNPIGNNVGIGTIEPQTTLDVQGPVRFSNRGDGAVLLNLSNERHWEFRQLRSGASTALELASVGGRGNKDFVINTTGRVGVGTANPTEKLEVNGNILATGDVILSGADCAEDFEIDESYLSETEPGTVMVLDDDGNLRPSATAYDKRVAGVVSGAGNCRPGIILDRQSDHARRRPLALVGKVFCKVEASVMPIAVGDLLTTSATPGHAMKAADPLQAFGAVLGKALRPLKEGCGLIPILVALQ
jgi:hypothetical protein